MAYNAHDKAVMQRVNRHIREANAAYLKSTVAEKLEMAWSANIREREQDSTNIIGRDADYYFAARKQLATSDWKAVKMLYSLIGEAGWIVYAGLKIGTEIVGHPEWMRTDKDKPNAPVGGFMWMNRGIADAFSDDGEATEAVTPHSE